MSENWKRMWGDVGLEDDGLEEVAGAVAAGEPGSAEMLWNVLKMVFHLDDDDGESQDG